MNRYKYNILMQQNLCECLLNSRACNVEHYQILCFMHIVHRYEYDIKNNNVIIIYIHRNCDFQDQQDKVGKQSSYLPITLLF